MGAAGFDKISGGIEFHSKGEDTKKECLKAVMNEVTRFRVKGCDLVGNGNNLKNQLQLIYVK